MTTKTAPRTREIPLAKLVPSEANVRRTGRDAGIAQLAASIAAHGLIQSLSVRPLLDDAGKETGKYAVSGGNRRLAALQLLAKRKEIAKNHLVPCVINQGNEEEVSLAENFEREALHPADQFEAFQRQVAEHGRSIEEIAARFGVTAAFVKQRLRLASVSPKLMQAYRDGDLTLDQMMGFAITEDHARQEQVYESLPWDKGADTIRRMLMEQHVRADDRRAVFVGAEAYEAAGGTIVRDLFSEEGEGYFADPAMLDQLALLRLGVIAGELKDAEGWKWVQHAIDFPHGHGMRREFPEAVELPEHDHKRLVGLQGEYDALAGEWDGAEELPAEIEAKFSTLMAEIETLTAQQHAYPPEVIARCGAILSIAHDGSVHIVRGLVRPEDAARPVSGEAEGGDGEPHAPTAARAEKTLSDALIRDLTAHRTLGLRLALSGNPDVALIAITHALASELFYSAHEHVTCLDITARETPLRGHAEGIDDTEAAKALNERHEAWGMELPCDASELWDFIAGLGADRMTRLLAHCVGLTVSAVRHPHEREAGKFVTADRMAEALALDMSAHWQPTVRSYLGRVSKAQIIEAVREAVSEQATNRIAGLKKQAMADAAEKLLAGTGWLPVLLRTSKADQPTCLRGAEASLRRRQGEAEALSVAAE